MNHVKQFPAMVFVAQDDEGISFLIGEPMDAAEPGSTVEVAVYEKVRTLKVVCSTLVLDQVQPAKEGPKS